MLKALTKGPLLPFLLLLAASCASTSGDVIKAGDSPPLPGAPLGLGDAQVLNRRDVVSAVAFAQKANALAFVHHVTTSYELTVTGYAPLAPRFQVPINAVEFDCSDIALGKEGKWAFIPSRQGKVRRFNATTGDAAAAFVDGQPLIRVALSPDGDRLAYSTKDGRVVVLSAETMQHLGEAHLHEGEVRGLVFADNNTLLSAGLDKRLVKSSIQPKKVASVALPASQSQGAGLIFLAHLGGTQAVTSTRDIRQPVNVVTADAVKRLGLSPLPDGRMLEVVTSAGPTQAPAVNLGEVRLRGLSLGPQIAALCNACVPPGVELALGKTIHSQVRFIEDMANGEVRVQAGATAGIPATDPPQPEAQIAAGALDLVKVAEMPLTGPATDLQISLAAQKAVVAFSHAPAIRSPDIYEAEKEDELPPPSPASGAVVFDPATLTVVRTFVGHSGFTVSASLSPDGLSVATAGWDQQVILFDVTTGREVARRDHGWLINQVRFSPDGQALAVAAWTHPEATGSGDSDPALLLYPVVKAGDAR